MPALIRPNSPDGPNLRLVVLLAAIVLGGASAARWYYTNQRAAMEAAAVRELSEVAEFERKQIAMWRSERMGDGRVLMAAPSWPLVGRIISGDTVTPLQRAGLRSLALAMEREFGFLDLLLVRNDGDIRAQLARSQANELHLSRSDLAKLCRDAVDANDVLLSDLDQYNGQKRRITLTVPVYQAGAMILEIDPSTFLDPLLKSWPGPSRTGETML